ncbi:hypothetical protein ACMBCN_00490 [Candidatus Liberibacter asiaticus]|nr:hypothetical protein [Candidatus Liberibacter asiaticus]
MLFISLLLLSLLLIILFRMFVGIINKNLHKTSTHPLGQPRGLTACCIC